MGFNYTDGFGRLTYAQEVNGSQTNWTQTYQSDNYGNRAVTSGYIEYPGQTPTALSQFVEVVDSYTRECPSIEVDTGLSSHRVTRVLDWVMDQRGKPEVAEQFLDQCFSPGTRRAVHGAERFTYDAATGAFGEAQALAVTLR